MKILFSPSELKSEISTEDFINEKNFLFEDLYEKRAEVLTKYLHYIQNASPQDLQNLFGLKNEIECEKLKNIDLFNSKTLKAIQRYTGVAFEYLNYNSLSEKQQDFLGDNLLIFSNLFGPILAKNSIPFYKLKQGSSLGDFKPEKFYKEYFSASLDEFLKDEFIVDLRAGFYEKFYTLKQPYVTMKFKKNGKVVSHWAKAYRGLVLKDLAKYQPSGIEEFEKIPFKNLQIDSIQESKFKKEFIFNIFE